MKERILAREVPVVLANFVKEQSHVLGKQLIRSKEKVSAPMWPSAKVILQETTLHVDYDS